MGDDFGGPQGSPISGALKKMQDFMSTRASGQGSMYAGPAPSGPVFGGGDRGGHHSGLNGMNGMNGGGDRRHGGRGGYGGGMMGGMFGGGAPDAGMPQPGPTIPDQMPTITGPQGAGMGGHDKIGGMPTMTADPGTYSWKGPDGVMSSSLSPPSGAPWLRNPRAR